MKKVLTTEMESYFLQNAFNESIKDLAKRFEVSPNVVSRVFKKHNILISKEIWIKLRSKKLAGRTSFTKDEDDFIKENYLSIPIKKMASILNRSGCGISGRLNALNLQIPKELADKRKSDGMYRKGQTPPNKGKKQVDYMSSEMIEKTKATRFKKGNIPHNALEDWKQVKRKDNKGNFYTMIKVPGERKLILMHRYLWEKEYGKIPFDSIIVFKDGNTLNCVIENLECITKQENMNRNTIHNYPEELKSTIRKVSKLKKRIKNVESKNNKL